MATKDKTKIMLSYGTLYYGAAGVAPVTAVGYMMRDSSAEIAIKRRNDEYYGSDTRMPFLVNNEINGASLKTSMVQVEPELVALALGFPADGQEVSLNSSTAYSEFSVKLVGADRAGTAFSYEMLRCVPVGDFGLSLNKDKVTELPIEFACLDPDSGDDFTFLWGAGNITATLATGVLTRTAGAGYHKVAGEGGAADVLTSITGASLTNGEILVLQIADASDAITLTHLDGTLELVGDVDWVMDSIYDSITLQYNTAGTMWIEVGRYDHYAG
ncbi:MAG: hypothetical protein WC551_12010 [Patescibacteria group bacterium]